MPLWLQLIVVVGVLLVGLAFLAMPFSVFGVKSRLETMEAQLEEIQTELRRMALRSHEPSRGPTEQPGDLRGAAALPAQDVPPRSPTLRAAARLGDAARQRAEPRLGPR